jgi:uncharacterized protein
MNIRVLGAAKEVGGSCIAVENEKCKVALDYGIKLDAVTDQYPKNFDAIIISHAHLDHTGSLPRLSKSRNPQKIFGSKITRDITTELLKDMIKIQNEKPDSEIYDEAVADKIKSVWTPTEHIKLPGMDVKLYPAGHAAGAKIIGIYAEDKTVVYTGDFCVHDTEILPGCNLNLLPKQPDLLISESTYGGKIWKPRSEITEQFLQHLKNAIRKRRNVLIPTFAFHRCQEMAKRIDQAMQDGTLPKYNVYVISKLASKITAIFNANPQLFTEKIQRQQQPFEYQYVKQVERTTDVEEPAIVICTSGFGHAGASLTLLEQWAESEDTTVLLTSGFLPVDSPLKVAMEKGYFKAVEGDKIDVQAEFIQIEMSGHADQLELVNLINMIKPKKTILVHGDLPQAEALLEQISGLTEACIPDKNETITI